MVVAIRGSRLALLGRCLPRQRGAPESRVFCGPAVARLKPSTLVLDGELAVFDDQLRSRFEWLRDPDDSVVATPPVLIAFDVLYVKGRDISQRPLRERRARLEDLLAAANTVYPARRLAEDGLKAWAQVVERGYEGLVAKDEASAYVGGPTKVTVQPFCRGGSLAAHDQCGVVARAEDKMNEELDTDERLWHPWLRINRVLRLMLRTRWSTKAWPQVKAEFKKALALRSEIRRAGWFN